MAKPTAPPVSEQESANAHAHPLLRQLSQTDEFAKRARERKEAQEFRITELEVWRDAVNGLASTPNGRLFLISMIQHSGMHTPASYKDTMKMVDVGLKSEFYLKWVRPFLTPELKGSIEP